MERVQKFMFNEEIDTSYIAHSRLPANENAIKITNGNFYWIKHERPGGTTSIENNSKAGCDQQEKLVDRPQLILKNINMQIKTGSFVAILGE